MNKNFIQKIRSLSPRNHSSYRIVTAGILSLLAYLLVLFISPAEFISYSRQMIAAARFMEQAIAITGEYCKNSPQGIDKNLDPNLTGLIGPEESPISTSLGHLEAKRTTTNPNIAALIVYLLAEAGVSQGDTIAIGSSASFPALYIATLAASKAMNVRPVVIFSLGASSYGATKIDFNLLTLHDLLQKKGVFSTPAVAVSLGGEKDIGLEFNPSIKNQLMLQIKSRGMPFIYEPNLRNNVAQRINLYDQHLSKEEYSAFINCGGSYANMGVSSLVLKVKPGLNIRMDLPDINERGVLFEMAARNIPCIHLLFIKGLVTKYDLTWDPIPLPNPGETKLRNIQSTFTNWFWFIFVIYFLGLFLLVFYGKKKRLKYLIKSS
jgi:poly-gamma-glutamate system protein